MATHDFCGPRWVPSAVRKALFGWFFEASCLRHDQGYKRGGSEVDRLYMDTKFLMAMLRDTVEGKKYLMPLKMIVAIGFFIAVRVGGWLTFEYD